MTEMASKDGTEREGGGGRGGAGFEMSSDKSY